MIRSALIDGLPRVMRPPDCACRYIGAMWYRRETAHIEFINSSGAFRLKQVEMRRANRACCALTEVVITERVRDE